MFKSKKSNDLLNRIESLRSFKDVKYIVYKELHRLSLKKCFEQVKKNMHWSDELGFIGYHYYAYTGKLRWGPLFNRRPLHLKHIPLWGIHMCFIHKVVFRNGDVPIVNLNHVEYKGYVQLAEKYLFSSKIDQGISI